MTKSELVTHLRETMQFLEGAVWCKRLGDKERRATMDALASLGVTSYPGTRFHTTGYEEPTVWYMVHDWCIVLCESTYAVHRTTLELLDAPAF